MATHCMSIFVNGNEAKTHTRDSKAWTPNFLTLPQSFHIHLASPKILIQFIFGLIKKLSH